MVAQATRSKPRPSWDDFACQSTTPDLAISGVSPGVSLDHDNPFKRSRAQYATYCAIDFASSNGPFRAARVTSMRRESCIPRTVPKDCSECVENFADEARLEQIDRLRNSLSENTYHVSAADLARKIIDHMMRL
jgi:hypothetical protein